MRHRAADRRGGELARLLLTTLRAVVLGALLSLSVGTGLNALLESRAPHHPAPASDAWSRQVRALMLEHHCSTTGFGATTLPTTALVKTPGGDPRMVDFSTGWAIYNGQRPGTLVAVCLDPRPVGRVQGP